MSRPVAAARRYAEAAFQVALAENQLDRWQADLALAAEMLGAARRGAGGPQPGGPARRSARRS